MSDKPDPGRELREEKQRMFAEQTARRERDKPLKEPNQLVYARTLLARLETVNPNLPTRIRLDGPPPGAIDDPIVKVPERIGGCFADVLDDIKKQQGAYEKEIEAEAETGDGRAGEDKGEADTP